MFKNPYPLGDDVPEGSTYGDDKFAASCSSVTLDTVDMNGDGKVDTKDKTSVNRNGPTPNIDQEKYSNPDDDITEIRYVNKYYDATDETIGQIFDEIVGDIDGDGVASYDTNCTSSSSDYCVLKRYVGLGNQSINCNSSPDINNIVKRYITNAKNSYSTDEPMYSFTLTSQDIKNIRDYNKLNAYDDYNMKCLSDDKECLSTFLTDWIKNKTVNGVALSASAQASVNNASCYETRVAGNWCSNH